MTSETSKSFEAAIKGSILYLPLKLWVSVDSSDDANTNTAEYFPLKQLESEQHVSKIRQTSIIWYLGIKQCLHIEGVARNVSFEQLERHEDAIGYTCSLHFKGLHSPPGPFCSVFCFNYKVL